MGSTPTAPISLRFSQRATARSSSGNSTVAQARELRRSLAGFEDRSGVVASGLVPMLRRDAFEDANGARVQCDPFEQPERFIHYVRPFRCFKVRAF